MAAVTKLLDQIPLAWRGLLAVFAIMGASATTGWAANAWFGSARDLPARVARLERERIDPARVERLEAEHSGLAYLICRAIEQDEGRDPRNCRTRLKGLTDYLQELTR